MKKHFFAPLMLVISVLALGLGIATNTNSLRTNFSTAASVTVSAHYGNISQSLTVTGTGIVKVKPDFATINLSVETKDKNLESAQKENAKIVERLVDALALQNISKEDIMTNWFNIYPEYDYNFGQRLTGHRVSNHLSVKVRDVENVGKIIDLATATGANIVSGVQFGIENNSAAYNEALIKAIDSARQKAAVLAAAADIGKIRIISVKETSFNHIGFARYDYSMPCFGGSTSILHNNIEVTATVKVVFGSSDYPSYSQCNLSALSENLPCNHSVVPKNQPSNE